MTEDTHWFTMRCAATVRGGKRCARKHVKYGYLCSQHWARAFTELRNTWLHSTAGAAKEHYRRAHEEGYCATILIPQRGDV